MAKDHGWIKCDERMPTLEELGNGQPCEVIRQEVVRPIHAMRKEPPMQTLWLATRRIVGHTDRYVWYGWGADGKATDTTLEGPGWIVTHWRPIPKFPKPIGY